MEDDTDLLNDREMTLMNDNFDLSLSSDHGRNDFDMGLLHQVIYTINYSNFI